MYFFFFTRLHIFAILSSLRAFRCMRAVFPFVYFDPSWIITRTNNTHACKFFSTHTSPTVVASYNSFRNFPNAIDSRNLIRSSEKILWKEWKKEKEKVARFASNAHVLNPRYIIGTVSESRCGTLASGIGRDPAFRGENRAWNFRGALVKADRRHDVRD